MVSMICRGLRMGKENLPSLSCSLKTCYLIKNLLIMLVIQALPFLQLHALAAFWTNAFPPKQQLAGSSWVFDSHWGISNHSLVSPDSTVHSRLSSFLTLNPYTPQSYFWKVFSPFFTKVTHTCTQIQCYSQLLKRLVFLWADLAKAAEIPETCYSPLVGTSDPHTPTYLG